MILNTLPEKSYPATAWFWIKLFFSLPLFIVSEIIKAIKRRWFCFFILPFYLLVFSSALAAEVDDLKKELTMIQLKISEEEARYQAAKAQMERAQVIAQYLFPELRAREKQLVEKIDKLNGQRGSTGSP